MKVLLITWNYPPKIGGMEMMMYQLVQHLRKYLDIHVIGPWSEKTEDQSVFRPKRKGLVWFFFSSLILGAQLIRKNRYDYIIAGSTLLTPVALFLGRVFKIEVVVNVYGLDIIYPNPIYQLMVKTFLPQCDRVVAISEAAKKQAVSKGVEADKIDIVPPGTDYSEFSAMPDLRSIYDLYELENRMVILSVGRLAKRKGVLEFVRHSMPSIVKQCPDVLLLVVGENPSQSLAHQEDMTTRIKKEIENLNLQENVRLLGKVGRKTLVELYYACDVFVMPCIEVPGDMEGFGIVLIEANSAGKPVVAANIGGIPDAVENGKSGLLVASENWNDFRSQILDLLKNSSFRRDLGQYGKRRVQKEFDWPVIAEKYLRCLSKRTGRNLK